MDEAAVTEQAEHCLLGPGMTQLSFEPTVCACDPTFPVWKDVLLLAGQRLSFPGDLYLTASCF